MFLMIEIGSKCNLNHCGEHVSFGPCFVAITRPERCPKLQLFLDNLVDATAESAWALDSCRICLVARFCYCISERDRSRIVGYLFHKSDTVIQRTGLSATRRSRRVVRS